MTLPRCPPPLDRIRLLSAVSPTIPQCPVVAEAPRRRHDPGSGHPGRSPDVWRRKRPIAAYSTAQNALLVCLLAALGWQPAPLRAQPRHQEPSAEDILPLTNDPNDPIGIDQEQADLSHAATSSARTKPIRSDAAAFGPEPPAWSARHGEVLSAVPSVHEQTHRVQVELSAGLASVSAELGFENSGDKPAEVMYRLAVPEEAALASLQVCSARGCRNALPEAQSHRLDAYDDAVQARGPKATSSPLPAADARLIHDARGAAIVIRCAPVLRSQPLQVRVSYLAPALQHAGVVRFTLPARGMDPRVAPTQVSLRANNLSDLRVDELARGEALVQADAWAPLELSARAAAGGMRSQVWRFGCGQGSCARAYVSAPAEKPAATDIVLAIDASPSTEGSARSRFVATIAAILARAPPGSRVRALRFASHAMPLFAQRKDPRELALSEFAQVAFDAELGAATRFESAWHMIEGWGWKQGPAHRLVVVVGDGGLTRGPARPFEAARRAGVEVSVVNVADGATEPALQQGAAATSGSVIEVGREADAAARGAAPDRLEERVAALFQPKLGRVHLAGRTRATLNQFELRAGDSVSLDARVTGTPRVQLAGRNLPLTPAPQGWGPGLAAHALAATGSTERASAWCAVERADLTRSGDRPDGQDLPAHKGTYCDRRGPAQRLSGLSSDSAPVSLAEERAVCARPPDQAKPAYNKEELGSGMPSSPLLSMLRQRILPAARGCFRADRAGRADYQVRAVFVFQLADREVVSAQVTGKIAEELRNCLLSSIDSLAVPRFTGKVVVRYPLVTEREPLPAQVELTASTADRLDAVISEP
jgi:hypothetical protein